MGVKGKMKKKKEKTEKVNKNMTFIQVLEANPEAGEVLMKEGMHCVGCGMAMYETLEQGCMAHGLNPDKIVEKLNKNKKQGGKK